MTQTRTCPRQWEAEAIEDGRLDGPERLSFEKHARSCAVCGQAVASLALLREAMHLVPALASSPLEHRRLRATLLRRANARTLDAPGIWRSWARRGLVFAISGALLTLIVVFFRGSLFGDSRQDDAAAPPPFFEVADIDGADWSSEVFGSAVHARLAAGTASFHVEHTKGRQRFLLHMPDGQIEVHGTRFHVEVDRGTTRRVRVAEGVVSLRVHGGPEIWLRAGEEWRSPRSDAPPASSAPATVGAFEPEAAAGDPMLDDAAATKRKAAAPNRGAPPGAEADTFASAVSAFRTGQFRRAEQLFEVFLSQFPRDSRAEDAWFLKAVARSRAGDREGASRLARDYLQRFPSGLRRREAEQLVTRGESVNHEGTPSP